MACKTSSTWVESMSKEIRARLRAAKAALSKKEFEETERLCRVC